MIFWSSERYSRASSLRRFQHADKTHSEQIRNLLGGNLVQMISGAAPLSPEVHEMLKICFSCSAVQGVSDKFVDRADI